MRTRQDSAIEFGDFQTPKKLATRVVSVLKGRGVSPASIVEPTCGCGTFIEATLQAFPNVQNVVGLEINQEYFREATDRLARLRHVATVDMRLADFFRYDWKTVFRDLSEPILVIGNPPWVTTSQLGRLKGSNAPKRSNFQNHRGLDAITGKGNFDIAEWMVIHLMKWLTERHGTISMLLKRSVARKVLLHAWKENLPIADADSYCFDAKKDFGVSVDACLLVCDFGPGTSTKSCKVHSLEDPARVDHSIGYLREMLLSDIAGFLRHEDLLSEPGAPTAYTWRSGVKHDCARVMEFTHTEGSLQNGLGESVEIEQAHVYPMLKGSGIANGPAAKADRYMLVTQSTTGESTYHIKHTAPRTWAYLQKHKNLLDSRRSSIYRRRPPFSVFGVGEYTFAPWKVAICGLYKRLRFRVVGPRGGRPVVFDDTVYFVPCNSHREAELIQECLHSPPGQEFLGSFIFWDGKRPITAEVLNRLQLSVLASELGYLGELQELRPKLNWNACHSSGIASLF